MRKWFEFSEMAKKIWTKTKAVPIFVNVALRARKFSFSPRKIRNPNSSPTKKIANEMSESMIIMQIN